MAKSRKGSRSTKESSVASVATNGATNSQGNGVELQLTRRPVGRPPEPVDPAKADAICKWVSEGNTLVSWCDSNDVSLSSVQRWLVKDDEFAKRYARAREDMGDVIAARMRQLAAEPSNHPDDVQHRRLMLDTDKWLLARWYPNRYGDRTNVEHSGGITVNLTTGVPET